MLAEETDAAMKAYAEEELAKLEPRVTAVEEDLKVLLLPKDPNDERTSSSKFAPEPARRGYALRGRSLPHVQPLC